MLKELLGEAYKEGMSFDDIETALKDKKIVDISTGEYVAKGKLLEATEKVRVAEDNLNKVKKDYDDLKNSTLTDTQKAEKLAKEKEEEHNKLLERLAQYETKQKLFDNGFSSEEVTELMKTNCSPETFAKISQNRVELAIKQNKAKGIKEGIKQPEGDSGKTNNLNFKDEIYATDGGKFVLSPSERQAKIVENLKAQKGE